MAQNPEERSRKYREIMANTAANKAYATAMTTQKHADIMAAAAR
jgi:hypothetical protein